MQALFNEPQIVSAIIDRTMQTKFDTTIWGKYLDLQETKSRVFKTYAGTISRVAVGSMIDQHAAKPIRKRKEIGSGYCEVGSFGDSFQMDNARLDELAGLIKKYNGHPSDAGVNEIVEFLTDDYREVLLAPMLAIDKMLSDARSRGKFMININGGETREIALPVQTKTFSTNEQKTLITTLRNYLEEQATAGYNYAIAEMNSNTFYNKFVKSDEFKGAFSLKNGSTTINPGSVISSDMASTFMKSVGIDLDMNITNEVYQLSDESTYKGFADNAISLLPSQKIGKLKYYQDSEWSDKVDGKTYTQAHGGSVLISSQRTEEGRFLDYKANLAPDIAAPNKMAIVTLQ